MPPWILRLIALGIISLGGAELFKSRNRFEITKESNCDNLFKSFNRAIEIDSEKIEKLKRAHYTIRDKIKYYFQNFTNQPIPSFFIQGSYKTRTLIQNINTKCDVDLGVFFPCKPSIEIEAIQQNLKRALDGHTRNGVTIKTNCVRINYVSDFHIDLPVYYTNDYEEIYFGSRGYHWEKSDPKAFINWFKNETYNYPQLVRIIRYLKAWSDNVKSKTGRKMPSGLALTIWAIEHYEEDSRDDIAFMKTATGILNYLKDNFQFSWKAKMPVAPFDNVLDRLSGSQKDFFYDELEDMISKALDVLSADNKSAAIKYWKQIFGHRFSY